jgi:hypothetical protein
MLGIGWSTEGNMKQPSTFATELLFVAEAKRQRAIKSLFDLPEISPYTSRQWLLRPNPWGQTVSDYRILSRIGSGGMGVV